MNTTYNTESSFASRRFKKQLFLLGIRDALPIGAGYFAVSFALGINASQAGLSPWAACLASVLCNASAGEYAGFTLISAGASFFELIVMTMIANARYFLMSCALSQKLDPSLSLRHRLAVGYGLTDEIFAISVMRPGMLQPVYTYGAYLSALPAWACGTLLGAAAGQLLPSSVLSALSVALYGMFLAIIIPPARTNRFIAGLIAVCFAASFAASAAPFLRSLSAGTRTILLTLILSVGAAVIRPVENGEDHTQAGQNTVEKEEKS